MIEGEGSLRYVASPLVTAMLRGGIAIVDEGNRMSEKSWASLAPLLDNRRYVESIVAGIKIKAHPQFRHGGDHERRRLHVRAPRVHPLAPAAADLHRFSGARGGVPDSEGESARSPRSAFCSYVTDFLQMAHAADERYTVRDGINVARFAIKLKSLATAADAREGGARDRGGAGLGRGSAALCPERSIFRFLIRAA